MYRKILATAVTMFLLMTSLAYAANMQVNSSAVPVSGGTIAPNGIKFFGPLTTDAQRTYVVTPKAGWTLTNVTLDGVTLAAPYIVPFDTSKIHTLKANFAQTLSTYSITTTAGAGGTAIITGGGATGIKDGETRHVVVGPNTGYQIDTLLVDGGPVVVADPKVAITVDFTAIAASHTVAATFIKTPVAINVSAGGNRTVGGTPAFSTTLSGSASVTATTIQWSLVSGPAGSSFGTPNALSTTFTGTTLGTYVVTLTVNGTTSPAVTITVNDQAQLGCQSCHAGKVVDNFLASGHKTNAHGPQTCYACHVGANTAHPGTPSGCAGCHGPTVIHSAVANAGAVGTSCNVCHTTTVASPDAHAKEDGCIDCHAVALNAGAGYVQDNNGVRSITNEFTKRSHHITGAAPTNAQCIVCHLEGKATAYGIHTDATYHMKDNKVYLRDANDGVSAFTWSGTEHTNMDNFCFSCHDSDGFNGIAASGIKLAPGTTLMSATNPFGDTLTNGYDQVARAGVVDVKTAFTTTNASHHAVSGQRYKYRFSTAANAAAWAARTGNPVPAASEIAEGNVATDIDGNAYVGSSPFGTGLTYDEAGAEEGGEATLFEGGKFVATYIPLGASLSVADNSTLHCGDCHTVGQWKVGSSTNADGSLTSVAIGAHGSANEYLLRNSLGTDAIHNSLTYVCFNCHKTGEQAATAAAWAEQVTEGKIAASVAPAVGSAANPTGGYIPAPVPSWKAGWNALHPAIFAGQFTGYATSHAVSAMHAQCVADSSDNIGPGPGNTAVGRLGASWYSVGVKTLDYLPAAGATAAVPATSTDSLSGNITGIACTQCHNSGLRNGFGGIHGGNNTYTDGLGRTQKTYRFMPGMGNYRYAPPGGWDGKDVSDLTLLTVNNPKYPGTPGSRTDQAVGYPGATGKPMGGCYTNGVASGQAGDANTGYSSCSHHGTSTALSQPAGSHVQAGKDDNFRTSYGGGTTGNPTTYEPTVREATAGGTLVTRPLKY